jgi:hypothetical protein
MIWKGHLSRVRSGKPPVFRQESRRRFSRKHTADPGRVCVPELCGIIESDHACMCVCVYKRVLHLPTAIRLSTKWTWEEAQYGTAAVPTKWRIAPSNGTGVRPHGIGSGTVVDIGGSHGDVAFVLVKKYRDLLLIVQDLPKTIEGSKVKEWVEEGVDVNLSSSWCRISSRNI